MKKRKKRKKKNELLNYFSITSSYTKKLKFILIDNNQFQSSNRLIYQLRTKTTMKASYLT